MSIYQDLVAKKKTLSVTGLGYVGLPLALELARHFRVIGFDINNTRVQMMKQGIDPSRELPATAFDGTDITFTSDERDLRQAHFHIIGVPTDIDEHKVPDLAPLLSASRSVGRALKPGDYVVYESTVYPGCTEEDCLPVLEQESGLRGGEDFKYGYSPERIVPGDKVRTLTTILKIVSGNNAEALEQIACVYGHIIQAGIHRASSIKVAEAAKVIENTQRDINISLVNELSIIFNDIGIDTREVLEAAGTKWNFHKYYPGLVGGHCISVDPFYLLHKARELGHDPQVIAAGRRVNDYMPNFIAERLVKKLIEFDKHPGECRILVLGITFKENVADIRNSKVVDLVRELESYSMQVDVVDPHADLDEVEQNTGITAYREAPSTSYDAIVLAVGHDAFRDLTIREAQQLMSRNPILFDLKGIVEKEQEAGVVHWRL
ncbi:MAG: nucleotide sugar dehydrogenase [Saprospiraceae bacterium]|nr:nucleotide sugar dehydrogenase [Saprospiraceae bacterium]